MKNRFRGSLEQYGVPLPADFDDRFEVMILGLRGDPKFDKEIKKFKGKQSGGDLLPPLVKPDPNDFLGPQLRWFVDAMGTPYAQVVVRTLFMFLFFTSYLEKIPIFGNILSAALDVMVAGGKALTKTIQTNIPPVIGLIPLPWMGIVGLMLAAIFGMIVWPMLAIVSLSRQDFAAAIESFIRVMPPPIGNTMADLFMEGNRMVARINQKREKLQADLVAAFTQISNIVEGTAEKASSKVKQGADLVAEKLSAATGAIAQAKSMVPTDALAQAKSLVPSDALSKAKSMVPTDALAQAKSMVPTDALSKAKSMVPTDALSKAKSLVPQAAGKALSRRSERKGKWHKRTQRRSERR